MKITIAEISVGATSGTMQMRKASAEIEIPEDTSWEEVSETVKIFIAGYALLWGVDVKSVHATVAIVKIERVLWRYGDVR